MVYCNVYYSWQLVQLYKNNLHLCGIKYKRYQSGTSQAVHEDQTYTYNAAISRTKYKTNSLQETIYIII